MSVFISVSTDAFDEVGAGARQRQPQDNVRRPLRGLTIKEDTYASIRVLTATGEELTFLDSSSADVQDGIGRSTNYSNFIIQSIQEQRAEKSQIIETFGEDYIYFFGERPRFLTVSGVLLNSKDFNWKSEFWANYEQRLRGTRLVEQNARAYLYFDDVVVEGFFMQAQANLDNAQPYMLPFQFQMFVCNYAILSQVGSVFFQEPAETVDLDLTGQAQSASAQGLTPPTAEARQQAAANAARIGSSGGLNAFLSRARQFITNGDFSVQSTLAVIRNNFYGRTLVIPDGLGAQVYQAPIGNQAQFDPAPTNRPIHEMDDEFVNRGPRNPRFDQDELQRVRKEMSLRTPDELEKRAREELRKYGIDTTSRRETTFALLGPGAFAAVQTMGSFAVRQAEGTLEL